MRSSLLCFGAVLLAGAAASLADAQYPYCPPPMPPVPPYPLGCAPMYMPYPHSTYPYGAACTAAYGPDMRPCMPFNGILPTPANDGGGAGGGFPQHPYIRSPRDFFMYYDRDNNGSRP